jgi:serine/threonine protein kinase
LHYLQCGFYEFHHVYSMMQNPLKWSNYVVWKIKIQNIALASTSTPGSVRYMAPEILPESKQRHVSPKCDVYSFGVLLIELVNGLQFTLDRGKICKFIQWAWKIHVEEDGFQQIFNVIIKNSIVGFNNNEAKLILLISLKCIQVIFLPNLLCLSLNLWSSEFQKH